MPNNNDTVIHSLPLWMVIEAHVVSKTASQLRESVYQAGSRVARLWQ